MSSSYSKKYEWDDTDICDPLGTDPEGTHKMTGYLHFHHTSDIITWIVNGENRIQMTYNELDALLAAMTEKSE